jgi:hypothetical protein
MDDDQEIWWAMGIVSDASLIPWKEDQINWPAF